jgi:hypothetical protein
MRTALALAAPASVPGAGRASRAARFRSATVTRETGPSRVAPANLGARVLVVASASDSGGFGAGVASSPASTRDPLDDHVPIDRLYDGLRQLHASPDVFLVDDFLTSDECDDIVAAARARDMSQSPVVYAGWTNDVSEIVSTAASGPALWAGALAMLAGANANGPGPELALVGLGAFALVVAVAGAGAGAWVKLREASLRSMRTSTSCVLDGTSKGEIAYVRNAERLMPGSSFATFEAPTAIRYAPGQKLAPHFDANRGADAEDKERGGQTLATLLVYLNDVDEDAGGETIFGRLKPGNDASKQGTSPLRVSPKKGQCLVFFPASSDGAFDARVEHEGAETKVEKWICRIWRHQNVVNPPFGLPPSWGG